MIDCSLGDAFVFFSCSFWSTVTVWLSPAVSHLKLQDRVVTGASFLTGHVLERSIVFRRSLTVLCILLK